MTDYDKLVAALRCKRDDCEGCDLAFFDKDEGWMCQYAAKDDDAADAIEALQAEIRESMQRCAECGDELAHQMPKRGEWVEENRRPRSSQFVCSECHRTAYDPQPTRDKAWKKRCRYAYCPNCGAKMFASDINVLNKNDTTDGPIITPCRGCSDYDGYGGCKSKGGCARAKMEVQE